MLCAMDTKAQHPSWRRESLLIQAGPRTVPCQDLRSFSLPSRASQAFAGGTQAVEAGGGHLTSSQNQAGKMGAWRVPTRALHWHQTPSRDVGHPTCRRHPAHAEGPRDRGCLPKSGQVPAGPWVRVPLRTPKLMLCISWAALRKRRCMHADW